ncbi:MAG: YcxB family protein [Candidatus Limnocylindrales bacterium]
MDPAETIEGHYQLTIREYLRFVPALNRGTWFTLIASAVFASLAILSYAHRGYVFAVVQLAVAAALFTGYYSVPLAWLSLRRHRAAVSGPVDVCVDAQGLRVTTAEGLLELPWDKIAHVRETSTVFFLTSEHPRSFLLPKRAFDEDQLEGIRDLAATMTRYSDARPLGKPR